MKFVKQKIEESITVKKQMLEDDKLLNAVCEVTEVLIAAFNSGNKLLLCGNGGSASDAQHLAAEFSGRYLLDRPALFAEALQVNSSSLTAIANDYGYDEVYARLLESKGKAGDILIAISTSGNSKNIIQAILKAKTLGVKVIGLTGSTGGEMKDLCNYLIAVPSEETPRIQEAHITIGHIICEIVEKKMFA